MQARARLGATAIAAVLLAALTFGTAPIAAAQSTRARAAGRRAAPPAVLTVTPNTNLVDDQALTVTPPAGTTSYGLCPPGYTSVYDDCTWVADRGAAATDVVNVPARIITAVPPTTVTLTDCRTVACDLVALDESLDVLSSTGPTVLATATLAFDPSGTLRAAPTVSAAPDTGLIDQQSVVATVHPATGDPAGAYAFECTAPMSEASLADLFSHCATYEGFELSGPAGGDATATGPVSTFIETPTGPVDCRALGATCNLVTVDPVGQVANAPLGFATDGAVQPHLLTRPDFTDTATVETFDLVGFTPNDPYRLAWCNSTGTCSEPPISTGTLDSTGAATLTLDPFSSDADSAVCSDECTLTALDAHGLKAEGGSFISVGTPIPEGPFRSKLLPVRATPHKGLHDGQTVTVTGSGFDPGAPIAAIECNGDATTKGLASCDIGTSTLGAGKLLTADARGKVSTTFGVHRRIATMAGDKLDCAKGNIDPDAYDAAVAKDPAKAATTMSGYFTCVVVLAQLDDYAKSGGDPIAFAGAHFKPLPWEKVAVTPVAYTPAPAPAATPVAATPTFTG